MLSDNSAQTVPRRVNLFVDDWEVCMLASMGMSTHCIAERTGLTHSQVIYRLGKSGLKRKAYRDGESPMAKSAIEKLSKTVAFKDELHDYLRAHLRKQEGLKAAQ